MNIHRKIERIALNDVIILQRILYLQLNVVTDLHIDQQYKVYEKSWSITYSLPVSIVECDCVSRNR